MIVETVEAKAPVKKKTAAKKKSTGQGNPGKPKSQAHKDAISAALKAYHASKKKGKKKLTAAKSKTSTAKVKATVKSGRIRSITSVSNKQRQAKLMQLQKLRTEIKNLQEKIKRIKASKISNKDTTPMTKRVKQLQAKAQKIRSGT